MIIEARSKTDWGFHSYWLPGCLLKKILTVDRYVQVMTRHMAWIFTLHMKPGVQISSINPQYLTSLPKKELYSTQSPTWYITMVSPYSQFSTWRKSATSHLWNHPWPQKNLSSPPRGRQRSSGDPFAAVVGLKAPGRAATDMILRYYTNVYHTKNILTYRILWGVKDLPNINHQGRGLSPVATSAPLVV